MSCITDFPAIDVYLIDYGGSHTRTYASSNRVIVVLCLTSK